MAVYYKFKSARDFDSIPIESQFISVATLKERIFESKHLGRGTDFDLVVSNAQTNEEYLDESAMIPKNTSVLIRRVPGRPRMPIVAEPDEPKFMEDKVEQPPPSGNMMVGDSSTVNYHENSEWDEFGSDLYAIPEDHRVQYGNQAIEIPPSSKTDEENKIKALVETPALDWTRQGQDGYGGGRGFGRGMGGRMMAGRGFGRGGFERKTPPAGYICYRCKVPGHFIQHCPTNGDPTYDIRKVKAPTGIPKSMLMATPDGSYMLPSGAVAVLRPNEAAFDKEVDGLPSTRPTSELPAELRCPLCKEVMKDAVLTGKCCFRSFCDKCIREYVITRSACVCGATDILADDLIPNATLRETINHILEATTNSGENVGSMVHVQDMESARPVQPRVPSPALSAASKDESKQTPPAEHSSFIVKEGDAASEGKGVDDLNQTMDKTSPKNNDLGEAKPESNAAQDSVLPENDPAAGDVQEKSLAGDQGGDQGKKKKKKKRLPGNAGDQQWAGYPDLGVENFGGMPMAPGAYNPYWNGGMPMGMDGFPFAGGMPYMGYGMDPFGAMMPPDPFTGMIPQDPYAAQAFMMQGFPPRDLSEMGMGMNQRPPMTRGEFEAYKADIRKKREFERHNEREHTRDGRGNGREIGSSAADGSSMMAKPRSSMSETDRHRRSEKPTDRHRATRDSRQSPPRHPKSSRSTIDRPHRADSSSVATAEAVAAADKNKKGSVFSRISYPAKGESSKKRKISSSENSSKDHHSHSSSHHRREERTVSAAPSSNGYKRSAYEHESSEEEEHHFKRRPSSSSRKEDKDSRGSRR